MGNFFMKKAGRSVKKYLAFLANRPAKRVGNSSTTWSIFNELHGEMGRKTVSVYNQFGITLKNGKQYFC